MGKYCSDCTGWGGFRSYANCYTEIFIQIGLLIRKISTDKLFRTEKTHTHLTLFQC